MPRFIVIRDLPGITPDQLSAAGRAVKSRCAEAEHVTWLRSFFIPETQQTHCHFEGPSRQAVADVNHHAQIPFTSIVEVREVTPDAV